MKNITVIKSIANESKLKMLQLELSIANETDRWKDKPTNNL